MNIQNISDINLETNEYCYLVGKQKYTNSSFMVTIPRIMQNVTSTRRESFNKNILINANICKPTTSTSVNTQNYITVKRSGQCNLEPVATIPEVPRGPLVYIADNTKLKCTCTNNNYKEIIITDYIT